MGKDVILVVEDEADIAEFMLYNIYREGFEPIHAKNGAEAIRLAKERVPALVTLDLMLPDVDGLEVCRALRASAATRRVPIIMVSAKGEETDVVAGLELGADDYITKPFAPKVLLARIHAVLRRRKAEVAAGRDAEITAGPVRIIPEQRKALVDEMPLDLTYTEFEILLFLARRPGWVFTRTQIIDAARGNDAIITDRAVDVQIVGLRKKMGEYAELIETVRGVGYRFREQDADHGQD